MIRRFTVSDAQATRDVFVAAVQIGALGRYDAAERAKWLPDPTMPATWAAWLDGHFTLVAESDGVAGFMMLERSGYLNMAYVRPDQMGKGVADALYAGILTEARALHLPRLTVLASRYAQGFFARHGWRLAPELTDLPGLDPRQGPGDNPMNRAMVLDL
jgi:putative acetyltransferase